jgi:hypothetical protein
MLPLRVMTAVVVAATTFGLSPAVHAGSPAPLAKSSVEHVADPRCSVTSSWSRASTGGAQMLVVKAGVACGAPQDYLSVRIVVTDLSSTDADLPATRPAAGGDSGSATSSVSDTVTSPPLLGGHRYDVAVQSTIDPADGSAGRTGSGAPDCSYSGITVDCSAHYSLVGSSFADYVRTPRSVPADTGLTLVTSTGTTCRVTLAARAPAVTRLVVTGAVSPSGCEVPQTFGIVEVYADPARQSGALALGSGQQRAPGSSRATLNPAAPGVPVVAVYYVEMALPDGAEWAQLPPSCGAGFHRTDAQCQLAMSIRTKPSASPSG